MIGGTVGSTLSFNLSISQPSTRQPTITTSPMASVNESVAARLRGIPSNPCVLLEGRYLTSVEMNLKDTECNEHIDTCQSIICIYDICC